MLTRRKAAVLRASAFRQWKRRMRRRRCACICIQNVVRVRQNRDPITLERIVLPFVLVRNRCKLFYDAGSLVEYIKTSGERRDPIARETINDVELRRLMRITGDQGLLEVVNSSMCNDLVQRQSLEAAFEREMGDLLWAFLSDPEEGQTIDLNPRFAAFQFAFVQVYHNLRILNPTSCRHFLQHTRLMVQRHPDSRTSCFEEMSHFLSSLSMPALRLPFRFSLQILRR